MSTGSQPQRIEPQFFTKVWGTPRLSPWFESDGRQIGEVWFPAGDLLIKFIFTAENLSVQVHPDDEYAKQHANSRGKTEMWYILRADPGARIALGVKNEMTADQLIAGAKSGAIHDALRWLRVQPGEAYLVPAGTVHAIGAGIVLCEIQQNSDVTYRIHDYRTGRELHLEHAARVSRPCVHPGKFVPRDVAEGVQLIAECPYFRVYSAEVESSKRSGESSKRLGADLRTHLLVVMEGKGKVNGSESPAGSVLQRVGNGEWMIEPVSNSGPMKVLLIGA